MFSLSRLAGDRGQSETLDTIFLIGIVLVVSTSALVTGTYVLETSQEQANAQSAEYSFTELDSEISLVAYDQSVRSRQVKLALDDKATARTTTNGHVKIEVLNGSTGDVEEVVMDQSMGSILYTNPETGDTIAYQGGGVWHKYRDGGSSMVSPPEFHYNGQSLTFPLVVVNQSTHVNSDYLTITKQSSQQLYPTRQNKNPVIGDKIRVNITSEYHDAWAQFYRTRVPGAVIVENNDETNKLVVELGQPELHGSFSDGAIASTGDITVGGNGNSEIDGPAKAAGDINCENNDDCVNGDTTENADTTVTSLNAVINDKVQEAEQVTSNPNDTSIVEVTNNYKGQTFDSGTYYIDGNMVLDGSSDAITADMSNGNVTFIVDGNIESTNDGNIHVVNADNASNSTALRIYSTGDYTLHNAYDYVEAADGDGAQHFQIYGTSEMQIGITGGSQTFFEGVIYAPRESPLNQQNDAAATPGAQNQCGTADVCIGTGSSDVYGSITAGDMHLGQNTKVTYDPTLQQVSPQLPTGVTPPKLTYLHVGVREISINGGNTDDTE